MNIQAIGGCILMMVWSARMIYSGTGLTPITTMVGAGVIILLVRAYK